MKKIKVIRLIARLNIGGPAIHAILLTKDLNKEKYESILVTGVVGANEGDMSYLAHSEKINPIIVKELGREISWSDDLMALWGIFKIIKNNNPDIVHTHTAKAGTLGRFSVIIYNGLLPISKLIVKVQNLCGKKPLKPPPKKIKLIHTFHGHVFHSYFSKISTSIFIIIEKILSCFTDRIITISSDQAEDICNNYHIAPKSKLSVIPLGLDLSKYLNGNIDRNRFRNEWGISDETILVGIIGRLVPIKNHEMFLDSVKTLNIQYPFNKTRFVIIGDGELREYLMNYASKLGIEKDIIFTGWQRDIEVIYASLDLVGLCSLNEGTPVSLIESMAAGKAFITTKVGGVPDLMGNFSKKLDYSNSVSVFNNGISVRSGDTKGFAEALNLLIKDKNLRGELGKNGRAFVKERFQINRLVKDMEKLYESLQ